jgi:hypothetical protein
MYDNVYQSEVFDEITDLSPSLVAEVECPEDMDCKIRINVMYSSNLSSGKDIVLCGATFTLRELKREGTNATLTLNMQSEHVFGAKAYVEIIPPLRKIFVEEAMALTAPMKQLNPLYQKYVFYSEDDPTTPMVDVEEFAWEPRLAVKVSLLYLENVMNMLLESYQGWIERTLLEQMRQGRFETTEKALKNGWHEMKVSVQTARIKAVPNSNDSAQQLSPAVNDKVIYVSYYPVFKNDESYVFSKREYRESVKNLEKLAEESFHSLKKGKGLHNTFDPFGRNMKRKIDEFLPSTYVEITYESR